MNAPGNSVIVLGFPHERVTSMPLVPFAVIFADQVSASGHKIHDVAGEFQLPAVAGGAIDRSVPRILEHALLKRGTVAERVRRATDELTSGVSVVHVMSSWQPSDQEFEIMKPTLPAEVLRTFKIALAEAGEPIPQMDVWRLERGSRKYTVEQIESVRLG